MSASAVDAILARIFGEPTPAGTAAAVAVALACPPPGLDWNALDAGLDAALDGSTAAARATGRRLVARVLTAGRDVVKC